MGKKKAGLASLMILLFGIMLVGEEYIPPTPECSDGIDNDGDGLSDISDPKCSYVLPMNPSDPNPPPAVYCPDWHTESRSPSSMQECGL